jgi:hypothetical protein
MSDVLLSAVRRQGLLLCAALLPSALLPSNKERLIFRARIPKTVLCCPMMAGLG